MKCECDVGEKLTEDELAEHLSTLLGDGLEMGSSDIALDEESASNLLETSLPEMIDANVFMDDIIGLTTCVQDSTTSTSPRPSSETLVK